MGFQYFGDCEGNIIEEKKLSHSNTFIADCLCFVSTGGLITKLMILGC